MSYQPNAALYIFATVLFFCNPVLSDSDRSNDQSRDKAKKHFEVGTRLFEAEDYKAAAIEFEISVEHYPTKSGYFNLANCYKALHRYRDSLHIIDRLESQFKKTIDTTMRQKTQALRAFILSLVGELNLTVSPNHATVTLDGITLPKTSFNKPLKLGPGNHRITASLKGYHPETYEVTIHSGEQIPLRVVLTPQTGTLTVTTNVSGATVVVDGHNQGETPLVPIVLLAGRHQLKITKPGYKSVVRDVNIPLNAKIVTEFQLTPSGRETAQSKPQQPRRAPYQVVVMVGTGVAIGLTGLFYGLAAYQASEFRKYDDAYVAEPIDSKADSWDKKRRDAQTKNKRFAALGLGFGIGAGLLTAATTVLMLVPKQRKDKDERPRVALSLGTATVSF